MSGVEYFGPEDEQDRPGVALVTVPDRPAESVATVAEALTNLPTLPGRDEFLSLAMQARILSMSGAAPKAVQQNPQVAFHVAMVGRDLGISPTAALELIDLLESRRQDPDTHQWVTDYRISLSPQLMLGQVRRLGLGKVVPLERTNSRAIARAVDRNGEVLGDSEFTIADAKIAGLVDERCEPDVGKHWSRGEGRDRNDRCRCNQGYKTYPKRMLWWRAAGFCCDDWFPEASLGLYQPEALGALVDDEGRPIDPSTVALPPGYNPQLEGQPSSSGTTDDTPAEPETISLLRKRIGALPDDLRGSLAERWKDERIRPLGELPARQVRQASELIASAEALAAERPPPKPETAQEPPPDEPESGSAVPAAEGEPEPVASPTGALTIAAVRESILEAAIADVAVLTVPECKTELERRRADTSGTSPILHRRLAELIAIDGEGAARMNDPAAEDHAEPFAPCPLDVDCILAAGHDGDCDTSF